MQNSNKHMVTVTFLAIAFLLPLFCIVMMNNQISGRNSFFNFILFGVEAASPSIAAIVAISAIEGEKGLKIFLKNSFSPKLKKVNILIPIVISFCMMFSAKLIASLILHTSFQINHLSTKKLFIIAWAFIAEEIGWRGFLHKKLTHIIPEFIMPLVLGFIWASWHYHYFIMGSIAVPIIWFTLGCIADCYIYLLLLKLSRGNILIAMTFHLINNYFINLFSINPNMNGGSTIPYIMSVLMTVIIGIVMNIFLLMKKGSCNYSNE